MYYAYIFMLIAHFVFLSTTFILLCILIVKLIQFYRNEGKIQKTVYDLQMDLTNEKVNNFANIIDAMDIPNRAVNWKTIKAGYQLIILNNNIDSEVKEHLKIILLSKGVNLPQTLPPLP